jgi:hypothetical protein
MAGMVAALAMALFVMIAAATYLDLGFYTPLYLVAAIVDPGPLRDALAVATPESRFTLDLSPAVAGMAVHLGIGAGFGLVFAVLARVLRLHGPVMLLAGAGYGVAVMLLMGLVLLPWLAPATAGGSLLTEAAGLFGWPTSSAAHLLFGLVLGAWMARQGSNLYAAGEPTR